MGFSTEAAKWTMRFGVDEHAGRQISGSNKDGGKAWSWSLEAETIVLAWRAEERIAVASNQGAVSRPNTCGHLRR